MYGSAFLNHLEKSKWRGAVINGGAEVKLLERTERTAIIELGMSAQELDSYLDDWGEVPTPPYIRRKVPAEEYQQCLPRKPGAVAAPTAGLHFTEICCKI